jgi:hypothetical protein
MARTVAKIEMLAEVPISARLQDELGPVVTDSNNHRDLRILAALQANAANFLVTDDVPLGVIQAETPNKSSNGSPQFGTTTGAATTKQNASLRSDRTVPQLNQDYATNTDPTPRPVLPSRRTSDSGCSPRTPTVDVLYGSCRSKPI